MNMKLGFVLTMWLAHFHFFCYSKSTDISETDMREVYDKISEEMVMALTISHKFPESRQKRELSLGKQSLIDDKGVDRLMSVKPVAKLCNPAIRTLFVDDGNATYAICISEATLDRRAEVVVGYYREHTWTESYKWQVFDPAGVVSFRFKSHLYVLVADRERGRGTNLVKINLKTGVRNVEQEVPSNYATSIALWQMKIDGKYNLAIANSAGYRDSTDLDSEVLVYEWKETYFDNYASFRAYDVKDIEPFHIYGSAYIAVANFRRGRYSLQVDSEIFRYDIDENSWKSSQKIRTYGAMDWEFFTLGTSLGQEFFLAVANKGHGDPEAKSMIYKFVEDKFLPFQCLHSTGATSIAVVSTESAFVLAVANEADAVHLYQYDGWQFVKSIQSTRGAMSDGAVHLDFHRVMRNSENSCILSVSNPKHPLYMSVLEMEFKHENVLEDWRDRSAEWCFNVLSKIEKTDIDRSTGNFDDVIYTDQSTITINGDLVFENGFQADTLKTSKLTELSTKEVYDDNLLVKLAQLQKRLKTVKEKLDTFVAILKNSLKIEGNQNITSLLEFQDAVFDCKSHSCHFENIYTDILNGERISDWSNRLVFLDSDQFINGTLYADKINATSIHVHGLVDGVDSQTLVTKSGYHVITAPKTFHDLISSHEMKVSGTVDGVVINYSNVLLTTGHQTIHGNLSFDELQTTWLNAKQVNGRDFTKFYNDLVLTDRPFTITGEKTFNDVTIDELTMNTGSKINEVDLSDLWKNTFWKDGNQDIKAEIIFSDVLIEKNLNVSLGINGIRIPGPRIVDITEPALITSPHIFQNSTKISHLQILHSLNGRPLVPAPDGSKQLDIMLKSGDQIVTGVKTFQTIHLDADSYVDGTVDGVDLSEFKASVLRKDTSVVTNGTWVFNNLVIKGPLSMNGKISGIDLHDVYTRALKLDDPTVPDMIFKECIYVEDLQSNNINGIDLKNDLVLVNEPQTITGHKIFNNIILEENSVVHGLVNNVNLSFYNEVILKIGDQTIQSKVFKRNVVMKDLKVTGSINGIPVTDIVTLRGGQIFGSRVLSNVTFTTIEANNVQVTGKVNGIDLQDMIEDTMTYDGYQTVGGKKEFKGTIFVVDGTNLVTSDFNGIDLKNLWDDAVLLDVPQQITGNKTFENNVVFDKLSFDATLDGVSEWDMRYNWMLKDSSQTIEGDVVFEKGFSAESLTVGKLNGVDINSLESQIVKLNEITEIEGPIIFESSIASNGNISLTGKVQGIDLSDEAVERGKIILTGEKKFLKDLSIEGDLTVDGTIDGIYIEELCSKTILGNKEQNISRLIIKGDVTFLGGGTLGGNLAGVDLKLLEDIAVKSDGTPIKFTGLKSFSNVTFEGPVTVQGKIGNVDLKELAENYMSLTKDQEIPAKMQFEDISFRGVLSAETLDTHNKEINHINLQTLNNRILKTSGTQNVNASYHIDEVLFEGDVFVAGQVNGLDLPNGLMRHNHTNYIQSPKIFEKSVIVIGDLNMEEGKTIQGVDVSDWNKKAVLKDGKFEIHGYKTFNKLELNDIIVEGMLDGLKFSEDNLLMTYGNQVITGRKIVVGNVIVEGSLTVDGLINDIDLSLLSRETLQRDRNNTVTGLKYFSQPLTIVHLQAPTVAGVDIIKLQEKLNTSLSFDRLENQLDEIEGVVSHMQTAFDNEAVLFQYYELYDEFGISTAYNWFYVSGQDCGELLFLSDNSSSIAPCTSVRIFGYDERTDSFLPARQELATSYAVSIKSLKFQNSTYIFVANQNPSCSSNYSRATTDIYAWHEDSFKKLQSIPVHQPADMVAFKDGHFACLVILEHNNSTVQCASESNTKFTVRENLFTTGGQKASVIQSLRRIILAVAAVDVSNPRQNYMEEQNYIDIYMSDSGKAAFGSPKQVLQSTFVQSIVLMTYREKKSEDVFLVVAEGSFPKIHNEPRIIIYRYEESPQPFKKYQEIKDYGTLDWIYLNTGELLFFALDSLGGQIKVYQYKRVSGFVKIDTIKSLGTTSVHAFTRSRPEDWFNHYLALAGPRAHMAQPTQGVDYAKILKSKVKGNRPFY